ncbi:MAG: DUF4330 family protein [Caldisericaceae bacterium]
MLKKVIISIVLVVVLIGAVLVIYKVLNPKNAAVLSEGNYIEATFMSDPSTNLDPVVSNTIQVGGTIYDSAGKAQFKITDVKVTPMIVWNTNSNGQIVKATHPYYVTVTITAKSINKKYAWAYPYGTDLILSGAHVAIYGDNWKIWSVILSVKDVK